MTAHYPIAIIGAGLGGLTTARILHIYGYETAVFELEVDRDARTQGGMLDIHEHNGQKALHSAGLHERFLELVHRGGEAMRILDRNGVVYRDESDNGASGRPEVDRGLLRDLLLDSLPDGMIRWGHKVVAVRPVEVGLGHHEVEFANGVTITTDLLIGADGAWSKVRPTVSTELPAYSGISFIEVDLHDADEQHPREAAIMGTGMLFALGGDTGILGHREGDGSLHVYLGHRADEHWVDTLDFHDTPASKAAILEILDGWDDSLRGLIENADTPLTPRRINALPVGHSWARVPGVTLVGDAAHVMSPFAGEGANLAMYDGAQLAEAIIAHRGDTESALSGYETELFSRSAKAARESSESLALIFAHDAPMGLVETFEAFDKN